MTDTPAKPLTADEVAAKRRQIECDVCETRLGLYRLTDTQRRTIEQQAEQIERLRGSLSAIRQRANERHGGDFAAERDTVYAMHSIAVEALSATEPKP